MTSRPPSSFKPPPPPRTPSGLHPAVKAYRDKLDSVAEHPGEQLTALDAELAEFLAEVRTPVPPADDELSDEDPTTPIGRAPW